MHYTSWWRNNNNNSYAVYPSNQSINNMQPLQQNQGKKACDYKPVIDHVSLINTPTTVGVSRRIATVNQTRPFFHRHK